MTATILKVIGWITIVGGGLSSFAIFDGVYVVMFMFSCVSAGLINIGIAQSIENSAQAIADIFEFKVALEKQLWQGVRLRGDQLSEVQENLGQSIAAKLLEERDKG